MGYLVTNPNDLWNQLNVILQAKIVRKEPVPDNLRSSLNEIGRASFTDKYTREEIMRRALKVISQYA